MMFDSLTIEVNEVNSTQSSGENTRSSARDVIDFVIKTYQSSPGQGF